MYIFVTPLRCCQCNVHRRNLLSAICCSDHPQGYNQALTGWSLNTAGGASLQPKQHSNSLACRLAPLDMVIGQGSTYMMLRMLTLQPVLNSALMGDAALMLLEAHLLRPTTWQWLSWLAWTPQMWSWASGATASCGPATMWQQTKPTTASSLPSGSLSACQRRGKKGRGRSAGGNALQIINMSDVQQQSESGLTTDIWSV